MPPVTSVTRTGTTPLRSPINPDCVLTKKEFTSVDDFVKASKKANGHFYLSPGKSFMVYVPMAPGANIALKGFNKHSPFSFRVVPGKPAPIRTPGQWIEVTARANGAIGKSDRLQWVTTPVVPGGKEKTLVSFNLTVVGIKPLKIKATCNDPSQRVAMVPGQPDTFSIKGRASCDGFVPSFAAVQIDGKTFKVDLTRAASPSDTAAELDKMLRQHGYRADILPAVEGVRVRVARDINY